MKLPVSTSTRRIAPWALAAAVVGGALWLWPSDGPEAPINEGRGAPTTAGESSSPAAGTAFGGVLRPGARTSADFWAGRYGLDFHAKLDGAAPHGAAQHGALDITASLDVVRAEPLDDAPADATGDTEAEVWYVGRLLDVEVDATRTMLAPYGLDATDPARDLGHAFAFRVDSNGAVIERRFDPSLPAAGRLVAAAFTGGFQIRRPEPPEPAALGVSSAPVLRDGESPWQVAELGLTRPIEVSYAPGEGPVLFKRWTVAAPGPRGDDDGGSRGVATIWVKDDRLDRGVWTLTAETDVAAALGGPNVPAAVFTSRTHLEVRRSSDTSRRVADRRDALRLAAMESVMVPTRAEVRDAKTARPERSWDALIAEAAEAEAREDHATRREAMRALARHAEADDAAVDRLAVALREGPSADLERTLVEALVSTRSAYADVIIADVLRDPGASGRVRRSLASASTFVRPGPSLRVGLAEAAAEPVGEMSTAALWAMAGQSRLLRETDPGLAKELADEVMALATPKLEALEASADGPATAEARLSVAARAELRHWLEAVGAVGGAEVWGVVAPWLEHPDPWIRRYAVGAARFVPTAEARMAIVEAMGRDPDPQVRRAAVDSAAWQPQATMEAAVLRALETDDEGIVRLAAAHQVSVWSTGSPVLLDTLRRVAVREPREDLRGLLLGFLPDGVFSEDVTPAPASRPSSVPGGRP